MSRLISNSSIYKDTLESLLLKVNELSHAFSYEVITANSTYANTGDPTNLKNSQVYGKFGANTLYTTNGIRGGNVSTSDTLQILSNTTHSGTQLHQNTYLMDSSTNSNIGSSTNTNIKIYSFDKTQYSSGKFNIQIKNGSNTQISELVLAHNSTSSFVTTYGTVSSPQPANSSISLLGNFSSNVNGANVELLVLQKSALSSVKVIATLIK